MELKRILNKNIIMFIIVSILVNALLFYSKQIKDVDHFVSKTMFAPDLYADDTFVPIDVYKEYSDIIHYLQKYPSDEQFEKWSDLRSTFVNADHMNDSELAKKSLISIIMNKQFQYVQNYNNEINDILQKADNFLTNDLFGKPNTYSHRNILKTRYDFVKIQDIKVSICNEKLYESFFEYRLGNYIILILLVITVLSILNERKSGLWTLMYATPYGRKHLALRRIGVLAIVSLFYSLIIQSSTFILSFIMYGGEDDLFGSIQSVPMFSQCMLSISRFNFIIIHIFILSVSMFAISLIIWFILSSLNSFIVSFMVLTIFFAVELVCYIKIPFSNFLSIFRHINIFNLMFPVDSLARYLNWGTSRFLFEDSTLFYFCLIVSILIFGSLCLITNAKKYPIINTLKIDLIFYKLKSYMQQISFSYSLTIMEIYKILILQKVLIIYIFMIYMAINSQASVGITYLISEADIMKYYKECDGSIDSAEFYITEQTAELEQLENQLNILTQNLEYDVNQATSILTRMEQVNINKNTLQNQVNYLKTLAQHRNIKGAVISPYGYEAFFLQKSNTNHEKYAFLSVCIVLFTCCGIFSYEKQQSMVTLIKVTPKGRLKLFKNKIAAISIVNIILISIIYLIQWRNLSSLYQLNTNHVPIQSLMIFSDFSFKISIGQYIFCLYLYRILMMVSLSFIIVLISILLGYWSSIITSFMFVIPYFLNIIGIQFFDHISIIKAAAYNTRFAEYGNSIQSYIFLMILVFLGIACIILSGYYWSKSHIKEHSQK